MANQKLSQLADAGTLSAADLLYVVQGTSSRKVTMAALAEGLAGPFPMSTGATGATAANIPSGMFAVWHDTVNDTVKLVANVGGTLRSVTLT